LLLQVVVEAALQEWHELAEAQVVLEKVHLLH
jgi:hypothetical protein